MRGWILLVSFGAALTGCNAADPDALLGRWAPERRIEGCAGRSFRFEIRAGGALDAGSFFSGTWRADGDQLVIIWSEEGAEADETVRYQIDGDRIRTLDGNNRGEVLVRCGSPTASALEAERRRTAAPATPPPEDPWANMGTISNQMDLPATTPAR